MDNTFSVLTALSMPLIATDEFKLLGSSPLLIPAGLCLIAWMWIGGAKRMAATWVLFYSMGLAIVAASKMAYIGWGLEIAAIDFQGFSGHAMRSASVAPIFLYLVLHDDRRSVRIAGILAGLLFGALMAYAVCVYDTHSASESVAGFLLGAATSLGFIRASAPFAKPVLDRSRAALVSFGGITLISATLGMGYDPTYRWLEHAALYLSGNDKPYSRRHP